MLERAGTVLVCFAVPEEARGFVVPENATGRVRVIVSGMGRRNALRAVEHTLAESPFDQVLTCGFAGALSPALPVGAVVYHAPGDALLARALSELGAAPASFHCSPRVASTRAEKERLRATTQADVVEMESGCIMDLCRARQVPCATVRVISDSADQDLPLDFNELMNPDDRLDFKRLAWALLKHPGRVPRLLRLQRQTRMAAANLGGVLAGLLRR